MEGEKTKNRHLTGKLSEEHVGTCEPACVMAEPGGCRAVVRPDVTTSAGACSPALGGQGAQSGFCSQTVETSSSRRFEGNHLRKLMRKLPWEECDRLPIIIIY